MATERKRKEKEREREGKGKGKGKGKLVFFSGSVSFPHLVVDAEQRRLAQHEHSDLLVLPPRRPGGSAARGTADPSALHRREQQRNLTLPSLRPRHPCRRRRTTARCNADIAAEAAWGKVQLICGDEGDVPVLLDTLREKMSLLLVA
eukprot:COSAG06_NODE_26016_length_623_cov_2.156489_1_plen_147_part_00